MMQAFGTRRRQSEDGFILVAVLWILGGLATLASIYSLYVVNAATGISVDNDRIQAEASISSALELTAYYLGAVEKASRPTHGEFKFQLGQSSVGVGFQAESARIDLNTAPKELLVGLFRVLGVPDENAAYYADRIIGWRTPATNQNADQDKEVTAYRTGGLTYDPRQAPFDSVEELWLVLGLPPAVVERILPFVTVFSGEASVDVMDAAPEVLAAIPGMTSDRLYAILNQRIATPQDTAPVLALLGQSQAGEPAQSSESTRVSVEVRLADGRRINGEAVILLLEDAPEPYRILSWKDDFDG